MLLSLRLGGGQEGGKLLHVRGWGWGHLHDWGTKLVGVARLLVVLLARGTTAWGSTHTTVDARTVLAVALLQSRQRMRIVKEAHACMINKGKQSNLRATVAWLAHVGALAGREATHGLVEAWVAELRVAARRVRGAKAAQKW